MNELAIGVDIGGTRTKLGLVDLVRGKVLTSIITPTETTDEDLFIKNICQGIDTFREFAAQRNAQITGIGFGIPGFVFENGVVDSTYGFLKFMEDFELKKIVEEKTKLPCKLDNDARVVALGEALYGAGMGAQRVLVLTLGTGLGVGFIVNGKLNEHLPFAHMAGHMKVANSEIKCYCGKYGCLESLVSATALCQAAEESWQKINQKPLTAENIFKARAAGDRMSEQLIGQLITWLRDGIDNFVNIYAPDVVILGGGMSRGLAADLDKLSDPTLLNPYKAYRTRLEVSKLNEDAGILGSAALFI